VTCSFLRDDKGTLLAIVCTAPWGIGSYTYRWTEDGVEHEEPGYGFYQPPNPHDFYPDGESCTPEEIAAHREACEAWDAAEGKP